MSRSGSKARRASAAIETDDQADKQKLIVDIKQYIKNAPYDLDISLNTVEQLTALRNYFISIYDVAVSSQAEKTVFTAYSVLRRELFPELTPADPVVFPARIVKFKIRHAANKKWWLPCLSWDVPVVDHRYLLILFVAFTGGNPWVHAEIARAALLNFSEFQDSNSSEEFIIALVSLIQIHLAQIVPSGAMFHIRDEPLENDLLDFFGKQLKLVDIQTSPGAEILNYLIKHMKQGNLRAENIVMDYLNALRAEQGDGYIADVAREKFVSACKDEDDDLISMFVDFIFLITRLCEGDTGLRPEQLLLANDIQSELGKKTFLTRLLKYFSAANVHSGFVAYFMREIKISELEIIKYIKLGRSDQVSFRLARIYLKGLPDSSDQMNVYIKSVAAEHGGFFPLILALYKCCLTDNFVDVSLIGDEFHKTLPDVKKRMQCVTQLSQLLHKSGMSFDQNTTVAVLSQLLSPCKSNDFHDLIDVVNKVYTLVQFSQALKSCLVLMRPQPNFVRVISRLDALLIPGLGEPLDLRAKTKPGIKIIDLGWIEDYINYYMSLSPSLKRDFCSRIFGELDHATLFSQLVETPRDLQFFDLLCYWCESSENRKSESKRLQNMTKLFSAIMRICSDFTELWLERAFKVYKAGDAKEVDVEFIGFFEKSWFRFFQPIEMPQPPKALSGGQVGERGLRVKRQVFRRRPPFRDISNRSERLYQAADKAPDLAKEAPRRRKRLPRLFSQDRASSAETVEQDIAGSPSPTKAIECVTAPEGGLSLLQKFPDFCGFVLSQPALCNMLQKRPELLTALMQNPEQFQLQLVMAQQAVTIEVTALHQQEVQQLLQTQALALSVRENCLGKSMSLLAPLLAHNIPWLNTPGQRCQATGMGVARSSAELFYTQSAEYRIEKCKAEVFSMMASSVKVTEAVGRAVHSLCCCHFEGRLLRFRLPNPSGPGFCDNPIFEVTLDEAGKVQKFMHGAVANERFIGIVLVWEDGKFIIVNIDAMGNCPEFNPDYCPAEAWDSQQFEKGAARSFSVLDSLGNAHGNGIHFMEVDGRWQRKLSICYHGLTIVEIPLENKQDSALQARLAA